MKKTSILTTLLVFLAITITSFKISSNTNQDNKKLRHLVFFKFKDSASKAEINVAHNAFLALPDKIEEIKEFEWGLNNSPENLHQDLTHCYMLTFASEQGRAIYLPHPDHKAFGELLGPILEKVVVVDYWAN